MGLTSIFCVGVSSISNVPFFFASASSGIVSYSASKTVTQAVCGGVIKIVVVVFPFMFLAVNIYCRVSYFSLFVAPVSTCAVRVVFYFLIFLVKAAIDMFSIANSVDRLAIVLVKEVMVLRSNDADETKFVSACCVLLFTVSYASARSTISCLHTTA